MLEKYVENFDAESFVKSYMLEKEIKNKQTAISKLRKEIPLEPYFQDKIKKKLKDNYKNAYIAKISQGAYSAGGFPDLLMIYKGHYFGFEVKRPVIGVPSELQKMTIKKLTIAGGTAAFVIWPEQAVEIVENWLKENRKGE